MDIFMKNGVIQKPISLHAWKMIACCKGYSNKVKQEESKPVIEIIQNYLKDEYLRNTEYLNYCHLYSHLIETVLEVCNGSQIRDVLLVDIAETFNQKQINNMNVPFGEIKLSYEDLCNMLIKKLLDLQIRENNKGELIDLFIITSEDNRLISIDEAEEVWFNNGIRGRTKK